MSIFTDAWGVLKGAGSSVSDLATRVYHTISAALHYVLHLSDLIGQAWDWMYKGATGLGSQVIGWADQLYHLLRWLLTKALPDAARWALAKAVKWAKTAILAAERTLNATIGRAVKFLRGLVADVESWAKRTFRSIERDLRAVYAWVTHTGHRLADLVLHPDKMAAWLVGALVLPITKWLIRKSAPLIVYLAKRAATIMPTIAHTLEDAIHSIL